MTKTVLITGAAGGLGHSLEQRLSDKGWQLALVSRDSDRLQSLDRGGTALYLTGDVSTAQGAEQIITECVERWGHPPEALAHCAGSTLIVPLHRTPEEQYRACLAANLDSAFYTLKAWIQACLHHKQGGTAVLVSSVAARIGVINHEAIATAKAAVEGLARSAAATYASHGIRVNAIAPGLLRSPATERLFMGGKAEAQIAAQYPLGRYGSTEDAAAAMAWLLSDEAQWITGQILPVDGGFSASRPLVR
ncbi:short-chain dehydrogenase/reductase SDR [Nitrosococcus halophilus Nc 4]|uniref:Short-chain dehydrogenase/reductase SDR n=1 Tax=Nitrosococcus halophilus (strain Nc4) TaxID=472759 RepID=D5BUQ4_NITHN|nr:SDR family oxidoreductase [Nitrosococcus halophilus]ADE13454.1 short-chain dehydrogenase/reductase SDR [Nitrosococcus halophilus Nc 4]